jgi:glutamate 5-kinase
MFSDKEYIAVSTTTLGSSLGTGGMETKLIAAEIATAAGVTTIITSSKDPSCIFRIIEYDKQVRPQEFRSDPCPSSTTLTEPNDLPLKPKRISQALTRPPHTLFTASLDPMPDLKSWTSHTLKPSGSVVIDPGAYHALAHRDSGGKLLAAGVIGVIGVFASEQAVRIVVPRRYGNLEYELDAYLKAMTLTTPITLDTVTMLREFGASKVSYEEGEKLLQQEAKVFLEGDVVEVGRGLTNYNSAQITAVKGLNR